MSKNVRLKDEISFKDKHNMHHSGGLWAKTEVIGGYGDVIIQPNGISTLGETFFRGSNIVPIGGVSSVMSLVFGVQDNQITYPTLYSAHGIGAPDSTLGQGPGYKVPNKDRSEATSGLTIDKKEVFPAGHGVIGFAVGITGTAESDISVYKPEYNDNDIEMTRTVSYRDTQGKMIPSTVTGEMIPFRYTAETLSYADQAKYFGKKSFSGVTAYYLKRFETDPVIKHVWVDGTEIDEDTEEKLVSQADVWTQQVGSNTIATYTEMVLKISKKDIKEWFIALDHEDRARINTVALYTGDFVPGEGAVVGDYRNCRMFSKLIFNPEYLNLAKDLSIIYRVYGS